MEWRLHRQGFVPFVLSDLDFGETNVSDRREYVPGVEPRHPFHGCELSSRTSQMTLIMRARTSGSTVPGLN